MGRVGEAAGGILCVVEEFAGTRETNFAGELLPVIGREAALDGKNAFHRGRVVHAAKIDAAEAEAAIDGDLLGGEFIKKRPAAIGRAAFAAAEIDESVAQDNAGNFA
jgi:hypothetical protein